MDGRRLFSVAAFAFAFALSGILAWEGTAEYPGAALFVSDGMYGASAVFPEGLNLDVTDQSGEKRVRILVVRPAGGKRTEAFLVLAPAAAAALGLEPGKSMPVSVDLADELLPARQTSPVSPVRKDDTESDIRNPAPASRSGPTTIPAPARSPPTAAVSVPVPSPAPARETTASPSVPPTGTVAPQVASPAASVAAGGAPGAGVRDPASMPTVTESAPRPDMPPAPGASPLYVQIGAFSTAAALRNVLIRLPVSYPVEVRTVSVGGRTLLRLLVGPLDSSRVDSVKAFARSIGLPDAFTVTGRR